MVAKLPVNDTTEGTDGSYRKAMALARLRVAQNRVAELVTSGQETAASLHFVTERVEEATKALERLGVPTLDIPDWVQEEQKARGSGDGRRGEGGGRRLGADAGCGAARLGQQRGRGDRRVERRLRSGAHLGSCTLRSTRSQSDAVLRCVRRPDAYKATALRFQFSSFILIFF